MATYNGQSGSARIGALTVCITGWTVTDQADTHEVSDTCSNGIKEFVAGLRTATGSFQGFIKPGFPGVSNVVAVGTSVSLSLFYNAALGFVDTGAIITSLNPVHDLNNDATFTVEFQASKAYAWTFA